MGRERDDVFARIDLTRFHPASACAGPCPLHNPSDHHMVDWPLNWRPDRYIFERICEHGIGHPDPDSLAWKNHVAGYVEQPHLLYQPDDGTHGCDGCCAIE